MGFLDGIEKLINEHGSAVILKERITLANDKYSALEDKLSEVEAKLNAVEAEKNEFELNNFKLKERVVNLESQLAESDSQNLEEIKEKILIFLADAPESTTPQLSHQLDIGSEVAAFHVEAMAEKELVYASYSAISDTEYSLAQEGRGYLIERGLIK